MSSEKVPADIYNELYNKIITLYPIDEIPTLINEYIKNVIHTNDVTLEYLLKHNEYILVNHALNVLIENHAIYTTLKQTLDDAKQKLSKYTEQYKDLKKESSHYETLDEEEQINIMNRYNAFVTNILTTENDIYHTSKNIYDDVHKICNIYEQLMNINNQLIDLRYLVISYCKRKNMIIE